MVSVKRLSIATILGLVLGYVFWLLARGIATEPIPWQGAVTIILGYAVVGFAIGISALRLCWWLNGLLLGLVFTLPLAFGALWMARKVFPEFVLVLVGGLVIGLLIELITSVVFRAKPSVSST